MAQRDFELHKENTDKEIEVTPPQQGAEKQPVPEGGLAPAAETEIKNAHATGDGAIGRGEEIPSAGETASY